MYAAKRGIVRQQRISIGYPGCPELLLEVPRSSRPGDFRFRVSPGPFFVGPWIWVTAFRGPGYPDPRNTVDPSGVWCRRSYRVPVRGFPLSFTGYFPFGVCVHPAIQLGSPGFPRITERDLQRLNEHPPLLSRGYGLPRPPLKRRANERLPSIERIHTTGPGCPGSVIRIDPMCGWRPLKGLFL